MYIKSSAWARSAPIFAGSRVCRRHFGARRSSCKRAVARSAYVRWRHRYPPARYETVWPRGLTAEGIRSILNRRVEAAGFPAGYASPHGLRSGFITEALSQDLPLAQVMRLTLHKSAEQVLDYHDEKALEKNPGLDLLKSLA